MRLCGSQHRQFWLKNANIDLHENVLCLKDGPREVIPKIVWCIRLLQASDSGHGDEAISVYNYSYIPSQRR